MGCITDVPGVLIGHWQNETALTGCTVLRFPHGNTAAVETRGAAPGSRETALLQPGMAVRRVDAILLAGGSAFGLAAADGVVRELEAEGRGQPTPAGPVPIVPAAVIFDLLVGDASVRPGPAEGAAAFRAASSVPITDRHVGAGCGATVAKWRGTDAVMRAGIGSASMEVGNATVGAVVVANAIGDAFSLDGRSLTGGPAGLVPPFWLSEGDAPLHQNTTLVVVVTDAPSAEVDRMAIRAHDALAATLRPAHTRYDGDTVFAVAIDQQEGTARSADLDLIQEAAFHVTAAALIAAVGG